QTVMSYLSLRRFCPAEGRQPCGNQQAQLLGALRQQRVRRAHYASGNPRSPELRVVRFCGAPPMGEAMETAMSRRMNWERTNLDKKAKQSLSDEREFMERDRAARWLEHQEQRRQARLMRARQSRVAPSIARRRQQSNTPLPWEGESEFDEGQSKSRHGGTARKDRR